MSAHGRAIAVVGSGGAGVMTVGGMLLEAAARAGYLGLFTRLSGPQVRGGEAAALLRLSTTPVESAPDRYDLLVAIDWGHVERFAAEIPLSAESVIVADPASGGTPAAIAAAGAIELAVPLGELARSVPGGRPNMVALGWLAGVLGVPLDGVIAVARDWLAEKSAAVGNASAAAIACGHAAAGAAGGRFTLPPPVRTGRHWLLSGNEGVGLGALRGGIRFVGGYPITPSTEILEWVLPRIAQLGGQTVQAEDELAAINMVVGASYGGVPAMTITSGPGLSLMTETLGLAVAAEIPLLVVDVQRGGPSTGIPTKSEQSDLNLAVYGAHGDAPRLVLAPTSIADCAPTAQWAVELAEGLQSPAILLSDQFMGQARAVVPVPDLPAIHVERLTATPDGPYRRYAPSESGVSPMAVPGQPGGQWIAEGLTHGERGTPSSAGADHAAQLDKRRRKLVEHDYGVRWADVEGDGDLAIVTWGSSVAPVREAIAGAGDMARHVRLIALRVLAPLPAAALATALAGARRALVVELSHGAQLYRYLRAHLDGDVPLESLHRAGPFPFRPHEIHTELTRWMR